MGGVDGREFKLSGNEPEREGKKRKKESSNYGKSKRKSVNGLKSLYV